MDVTVDVTADVRVDAAATADAASASGEPRNGSSPSGDRSIVTPLASAMWPRSATSPSLTSIIAGAPARAAAGPDSYGGAGRKWVARIEARPGSRSPASGPDDTVPDDTVPDVSSASPAAEIPRVPDTATTSPGIAPDRRTGAPSVRSP